VNAPAIFLSAGESSGEQHAAAVAASLRVAAPDAALAGLGGQAMADAGVHLVHDLAFLQTVGLVEVASALPAHARAYAAITRELHRRPYDLVILVDYPGFHRLVARLARRLGIPVLHYIAPQLWAWGAWRARRIRHAVSRMAVILPFEEGFFHERGIPATFVGHPLLDTPRPSREEARASLGLEPGAPMLGLFPGSRPTERGRLWPAFRDAAATLQRTGDLRVFIAATDAAAFPGSAALGSRLAPSASVAAAADVAIAKSGTTTLELALAGTPHVLAYRMHPATYVAARRAVRVPWIGLVNLILGRAVVPEVVQGAVTAPRLATLTEPLLHAPAAQEQRAAFREVTRRLGTPGAARRVADLALEMVA
jgi:lipid-A-disaccharide synthase